METKCIQIPPGFQMDMEVCSEVAIIFCPDARLRSYHKLLFREGLGLGKRPEEYTCLPFYGGAAVLAHPEYFPDEVNLIRTSLGIANAHFGASRLVAIGHERCLRMKGLYDQIHGGLDPDRVLDDMLTVRRMFQERSVSSKCPVRKMFAQFDITLDVILMKFPTRNNLEYVVID